MSSITNMNTNPGIYPHPLALTLVQTAEPHGGVAGIMSNYDENIATSSSTVDMKIEVNGQVVETARGRSLEKNVAPTPICPTSWDIEECIKMCERRCKSQPCHLRSGVPKRREPETESTPAPMAGKFQKVEMAPPSTPPLEVYTTEPESASKGPVPMIEDLPPRVSKAIPIIDPKTKGSTSAMANPTMPSPSMPHPSPINPSILRQSLETQTPPPPQYSESDFVSRSEVEEMIYEVCQQLNYGLWEELTAVKKELETAKMVCSVLEDRCGVLEAITHNYENESMLVSSDSAEIHWADQHYDGANVYDAQPGCYPGNDDHAQPQEEQQQEWVTQVEAKPQVPQYRGQRSVNQKLDFDTPKNSASSAPRLRLPKRV
jgi:hypothetical protein